jgi:plasmid stability protein
MPVTLSIKTVPDHLAAALRKRARLNHRSLQGELMSILESAVGGRPFRARALLQEIRAVGVATEGDSVQIIRETRDAR